jgi:hypothetical protein
MRDILLVAAVPTLSLSLALGLGLVARSAQVAADAAVVVVLAPPWRDTAAVVDAAGGVILPLRSGLGVTAAGAGPGFADRLRTAGALLVLSPDPEAAVCGV